MLRQIFIAAFCVLAIVACGKSIDGLLTNSEVLTFTVKDKAVTVPAGEWETTIKFPSKKEVRLNITIPGQPNVEASFKVLKSSPIPQENGTFELLAKDSGQPYDVSGSVKTVHVDGKEQWSQESCSYTEYHHECHYEGNTPVCYSVPYTMQGWREVRFFMRDTTQNVEFNLLDATKATAGSFRAQDQYTTRIYVFQSMCR